MMNLKSMFSSALLALTLAAGSAFAGPIYHVTIDTHDYSGDGGLELVYAGPEGLDGQAVLSNFSGQYGDVLDAFGVTGAAPGRVTMALPQSWLWQAITFGDLFSFDVALDTALDADNGATFSVNLTQGESYLAFGAVKIELMPDTPPDVSGNGPGQAAEVPEPSTLLSLFTGIGLLGFTLRRRVR